MALKLHIVFKKKGGFGFAIWAYIPEFMEKDLIREYNNGKVGVGLLKEWGIEFRVFFGRIFENWIDYFGKSCISDFLKFYPKSDYLIISNIDFYQFPKSDNSPIIDILSSAIKEISDYI